MAKSDAENCANYLKGKSFELPIFLDIEHSASSNVADAVILSFLDTLKAKGYNVGLYTYYSYWKQHIKDSTMNKYDVWIADYRSGKNYSNQFALHQYTSTGKVLGISGNVDMNYLYKESLIQSSTSTKTTTTNTSSTTKTTTTAKPEVTYCSYIDSKWLGEIKGISGEGENAYSGIENKAIKGFAMKVDNTNISYRVHENGGNWYDWISGYNTKDWNKGVAGNKKPIDAIQVKINDINSKYTLRLRVSYLNRRTYLPWVKAGPWTNENADSSYAGIFGKSIDKVQIEVVEK